MMGGMIVKNLSCMLAVLLAMTALLLGCALAEASDMPREPRAADMRATLARLREPREKGGGSFGLTLSMDGTDLSAPTTWTVTAQTPGDYTYTYILAHDNDLWGEDGDVVFYTDPLPDASYTFQIMVPDKYFIWVIVTDANGNQDSIYRRFTMTDATHPTLDRLVQGVVDECRASGVTGDYETALWLHDWLVEHCAYDYTHLHHSAEAAFTVGTGVCDTYSKAYVLLLNAAGIEATRTTSPSHAWTCVKLEGQWTFIDPTWDDTLSEDKPSNLFVILSHCYFGASDGLMRRYHVYSGAPACDTLDLHYYYRKDCLSTTAAQVRNLVNDALANGCYAVSLSEPETVAVDQYYFRPSSNNTCVILLSLAAKIVNRDGGLSYDGAPVEMDIEYLPDDHRIVGQVRFDSRVLRLPDGLVEIGEAAFENARGAMAVTLPDSAVSIGPRAFAGMVNLWKVSVPSHVREIDDTAFEDIDHVAIACESGSYAEEYARKNNIPCVIE